MAEEERAFLARWSRRKRAARSEGPPVEAVPKAAEPEAAIDPASLPPIESLGPGSDVAAFLQKGVPEALRRAALRRIWTADPKIARFREVADYDWDFNAPGYGALAPGDDVRKAAGRLLARVREPAAAREEPAAPEIRPGEPVPPPVRVAAAEPSLPQPAAAEAEAAEPEPPARRRHGGAMPR